MSVLETINTVLAVRAYQDKPVSDEILHEILEAGRLTASASNRQPWNFVVVQDREQLKQVADLTHGHGAYVAGAAFAIVVVAEKTSLGLSDASRAIQDMILAAWSHGVGSNWVGFSGMVDDVNAALGIPAELDIVAVLPFGYPVANIGKGKKKRKASEEIVHWGAWGQHAEP